MRRLIFILLLVLASCATPTPELIYDEIEQAEEVEAPYGWAEFCRRYPEEC